MRIGFTGTQMGMTVIQRGLLRGMIQDEDFAASLRQFHHGDCIGADAEAHAIVEQVVGRDVIVIHPPEIETKRAFCKAKTILPAKPYLARNRDIVDAIHVLIAAPKEATEQERSGTWATIRYARRRGCPRLIIWPNGETTKEGVGW